MGGAGTRSVGTVRAGSAATRDTDGTVAAAYAPDSGSKPGSDSRPDVDTPAVEVRLIDFDAPAVLYIDQPVPEGARRIIASKGQKDTYHPCFF